MLEQPLVFTGCSSIQFFNSPPVPNTVSEAAQSSLLLTVPHRCDLQDTMPRHSSPNASHPNPCLGKQKISLEVASVLTLYLCSHSSFTSHQKVLLGRFYLCFRDCCRILYFNLSLVLNPLYC